jgi:hypothetical protein
MDQEEVTHLRELIKENKRRLHVLEVQATKYGLNCPPQILIAIEDTQEWKIRFLRMACQPVSLSSLMSSLERQAWYYWRSLSPIRAGSFSIASRHDQDQARAC